MYKRKDGLYADETIVNGVRKGFTGRTPAIVKKKMAAWSDSMNKGVSFCDAADQWAEYHEGMVTYNAHDVYKAHLKRAKEHFADDYLKDITPDRVQAYIDLMAGKGYARRTVQLDHDMMNMIFDYAITRPGSVLKVNPCASVRIPSGLPKTRREPPTDEQLAKILPRQDFGLFAYFLLYTGLRRGEMLGLKWGDIDLDNSLIHIRRNIYYKSNTPHEKTPKTDAGMRDVDLLDVLKDVLPPAGNPNEYLFGGETALSKTAFRKRGVSFCRELGCVA